MCINVVEMEMEWVQTASQVNFRKARLVNWSCHMSPLMPSTSWSEVPITWSPSCLLTGPYMHLQLRNCTWSMAWRSIAITIFNISQISDGITSLKLLSESLKSSLALPAELQRTFCKKVLAHCPKGCGVAFLSWNARFYHCHFDQVRQFRCQWRSTLGPVDEMVCGSCPETRAAWAVCRCDIMSPTEACQVQHWGVQ